MIDLVYINKCYDLKQLSKEEVIKLIMEELTDDRDYKINIEVSK